MANYWVLRIDADGVIHLYDIGEATDPGADVPDLAERITWARDQWGVPADWQDHPDREARGWDVAVMSAPVHPKLAAKAQFETWDGYPGGNPPGWPTPPLEG